jgi:hypothetical protein
MVKKSLAMDPFSPWLLSFLVSFTGPALLLYMVPPMNLSTMLPYQLDTPVNKRARQTLAGGETTPDPIFTWLS